MGDFAKAALVLTLFEHRYLPIRCRDHLTDLNYTLNGLVRNQTGRKTEPTSSILDSQRVKTSTNVPTAA